MSEQFEKPATHALWSPSFDQRGNFREQIKVGEAVFEKDSNGNAIARLLRVMTVVGYESDYIYLAPIGVQPPPPCSDILADAKAWAAWRNRKACG